MALNPSSDSSEPSADILQSRRLRLEMRPQPDDTTCGPTCLHAVYRYFGDKISLDDVISETPALEGGGTLAALLACHALRRGYRATIYTFNLKVFDPTWFQSEDERDERAFRRMMVDRLRRQIQVKHGAKLQAACRAYMQCLELGGSIHLRDLNAALIRKYLKQSAPILAGLSSTYLYGAPRENPVDCEPDDLRGVPTGHFVVLHGYDGAKRSVRVADPYLANPLTEDLYYEVQLDRLVCAILLGVLTDDANLLIVEPI